MELIVVPVALLFSIFFGIAAIQALRKNWKWAVLAFTASLIAPLVVILPMLMQIGGIKGTTKQLEHKIQSQKDQKTNGTEQSLAPYGAQTVADTPMDHPNGTSRPHTLGAPSGEP